jgi:hypothetical protein
MKMIEFDIVTAIQVASLAGAIVFGIMALFHFVRKRQTTASPDGNGGRPLEEVGLVEVDGVMEIGGERFTRLVFYAPESTLKQIRGFGFTVKPKAPRELIRRVEGKEE